MQADGPADLLSRELLLSSLHPGPGVLGAVSNFCFVSFVFGKFIRIPKKII